MEEKMTQQLYVITASGGGCDDEWQRTEFVTDDIVKGEEYVAAQNKLAEDVKAANDHIEKHMAHWRIETPCPHQLPYDTLVVPSFAGVSPITAEMRQKRKDIRAINDNLLLTSMAPVREWYATQLSVKNKFIGSTFPPDVVNGINTWIGDAVWELTPIAWLP